MNNQIASRDITYCTNKKCKMRKDCFRNLDNYEYDKNGNYWFSDFAEEYCEKGFAKK